MMNSRTFARPRPRSCWLPAAVLFTAAGLAAQSWIKQEEFARGPFEGTCAYDESRGVAVHLFWPNEADGMTTWETGVDGMRWHQRFPDNHPPRRAGHRLVYDPVRQTVLMMFGIDPDTNVLFNDVWEWDGHDWTQLVPNMAVQPPPPFGPGPLSGPQPYPRVSPVIVADRARDVIFCYGGGISSATVLPDVWEFQSASLTWQPRGTFNPATTAPSPGTHRGYAFNPHSQRVAIFDNGLGIWEWTGQRFLRMQNGALAGSPIYRFLVRDDRRRRIVGFTFLAGTNPPQLSVFEWTDTLVDITQQVAANGPFPQSVAHMVSQPDRGRGVMWHPTAPYDCGNPSIACDNQGEPWAFDFATDTFGFVERYKPKMPRPVVVHDSGNDRFLLIGPESLANSPAPTAPAMALWAYSPERGYTNLDPATKPAPRAHGYAACKHLGSGKIVLYGRSSDARTWVYDGNDWTAVLQTPHPDPSSLMSMSYDPIGDRVLAFAGRFSFRELWEWRPSGWTQLPSPPTSNLVFLTVDPARNRLVGHAGDVLLEYDDTTGWSAPSPLPTAPLAARVVEWFPGYGTVVAGGSAPSLISDETFAWDGTAWTTLHPGGPGGLTPSETVLNMHQAAYDPERQRIVEVGDTADQIVDRVQIFDRGLLRFSEREVFHGDTFTLDYENPDDAGLMLLPLFALDARQRVPVRPSPWSPLVQTCIPLTPDPMFLLSLALPNTQLLDPAGHVSIPLAVPALPTLRKIDLHAAALTFGPGGIQTITNRTTVQILP